MELTSSDLYQNPTTPFSYHDQNLLPALSFSVFLPFGPNSIVKDVLG
jgi:hypothetical protein